VVNVPRLSSVEESHEPLSPPATMTTTLEASTSHITDTSYQESVHMEVNTNVTNQEVASREHEQTGGETVVTIPTIVVNEVLTKTTNQEAATNQETATNTVDTTATNQETATSQEMATSTVDTITNQETATSQETNIILTVDMATVNQEPQSSWEEVSVDVEKHGRPTATKSFSIQAVPHRNVSLAHNNEQEEIEAKLTATL